MKSMLLVLDLRPSDRPDPRRDVRGRGPRPHHGRRARHVLPVRTQPPDASSSRTASISPCTPPAARSRTSTPSTRSPASRWASSRPTCSPSSPRVQTDPVLKRIASKTKMVFPLYNEEIHLLGRREITDFDDLTDRRVAIGREGSGTYLTARLLFKVSEVAPKEMVPIDTDEALAELKAGRDRRDVLRRRVPGEAAHRGVTAADELALIPITNKSITEFYPARRDPRRHVSRGSAAPSRRRRSRRCSISFDFRQRDCDLIGQFAQAVSDQPGVARQERPSEVEGGRPRLPAQGLGPVRLRREARAAARPARRGVDDLRRRRIRCSTP